LHIFAGYKPLLQAGDTVTWTAIVQAHCTCGQAQEALHLFCEMKEVGSVPNEYTYSCILGAIADMGSLHEGQHIHVQLMVILAFKHCNYSQFVQEKYKDLLNFPVTVVASLISMYAKCGDLQKATEASFHSLFCTVIIDKYYIFEGYKPLLQPGHSATVTWTVIIQAHTSNEQQQKALQLFTDMQKHGITPNEYTYSCILSVVDSTSLHAGQTIHAHLMVNK
jgi:pentatricopeptide repeat protein